MFPRLWVDQIRQHTFRTFLGNTFLLVALPALYLLLPQIVAFAHGYLRGIGFAATDFEAGIFSQHWKIIGITALFTFVSLEVQGFLLRRRRAAPFVNASFQALIGELARKAGLSYTPAIVFIPEGPVNAAATQSTFFGGKVLVMGDILRRLDDGEERAVFAHEISHLVNRDIWAMLLLRVGSGGISWQKWGLVVAMIMAGYDWALGLARTWDLIFPGDLVFLLVAWAITWIVHVIYKLGEMSHSRGREYLADVGAVALIGWEHRASLIVALLKVGHGQTGWSPFRLLRRTGQEIFMPHPAIADRAEALQVPLPQIA